MWEWHRREKKGTKDLKLNTRLGLNLQVLLLLLKVDT